MTLSPTPPIVKPQTCTICKQNFPSKNALFKHLKQVAFHTENEYVLRLSLPLEKVAILYGYSPKLLPTIKGDENNKLMDGEDVAQLVTKAVQEVEVDLQKMAKASVLEHSSSSNHSSDGVFSLILSQAKNLNSGIPISRTHGNSTRSHENAAQDQNTGALSEVMCLRISPLYPPGEEDEEKKIAALEMWLNEVNMKVSTSVEKINQGTDSNAVGGRIQVFGRLKVPKNFNSETDATNRKMSYLLPIDFFVGEHSCFSLDDFANMKDLVCFDDLKGIASHNVWKENGEINDRDKIVRFMLSLKKMMKKFITLAQPLDQNDHSAVLEKKNNNASRNLSRRIKDRNYREEKESHECRRAESETVIKPSSLEQMKKSSSLAKNENKKKQFVLRRKRYHNFTSNLMAHDFLAFRRLDRFHHKSMKKRTSKSGDIERIFVEFGLSGDLFLQGQVQRIVGLFIAVSRKLIDEDIIDCVFDEEYTSLVPTPPMPHFGLFSTAAQYMRWEGRVKMVLSPRPTLTYNEGWCRNETLEAVASFKNLIEEDIAATWFLDGLEKSSGLLRSSINWIEGVLIPWSEKAKVQLMDWRMWKAAKQTAKSSEMLISSIVRTPLDQLDKSIPELYAKTLHYLREADASGLWPTTTPKRKLVMVSNDDNLCLSAAHMKAKSTHAKRHSAYSLSEGQGGASGSFSIGAMPGEGCVQPKGNELFPELMKAAFLLEKALFPDREPSSTIAVNRNAQFRPHVDVGAGAGQSTSLIVGLGDYVGGELMVEGEKVDIRYNPVEFNGWKQRHWTLPFNGERFSLVWFTPKGCEGVKGIDLSSRY